MIRPIQDCNQYGFTSNMNYLLGALQRHEVEKFCIDSKRTFFGCSLDGESAFEVVNRSMQLWELYVAGERGQYWLADKFSYENTQSRIKLNGQLSRSIQEFTGVKQGNIKSSDHYKLYINPLLEAIDGAALGVWTGPLNVAESACADDEYLMTDDQTKFQELLNIAEQYGQMYDVTYGASKTKITVIGSEIDVKYYSELSPWRLNDLQVTVSTDNEHLGQVVSGSDQELKNV